MRQTLTEAPRRSIYPAPRHLAWWPDWEFTNDLLLCPVRPRLSQVTISAITDPATWGTAVSIGSRIDNRLNVDLRDARLCAVIIDEFGIIMTRARTRLCIRVGDLAAHSTTAAELVWPYDGPSQSYHLVLRLENAGGDLLDVVSGDFVLG